MGLSTKDTDTLVKAREVAQQLFEAMFTSTKLTAEQNTARIEKLQTDLTPMVVELRDRGMCCHTHIMQNFAMASLGFIEWCNVLLETAQDEMLKGLDTKVTEEKGGTDGIGKQ